MKITNQLSFDDVSDEYKAFVDKFKPKKTTDDCYTPDNIYEVVLAWVVKEYGIDPDNVVRPFWPGADYEEYDYPEGCTVVDNPPFSILSKITRTYADHGVKFFLFSPYLTNFSGDYEDLTHVITSADITYENGAKVHTSFLTNLDPVWKIRTAPDLQEELKKADRANTSKGKAALPKYCYPDEVVTAADIGYLSDHGIDYRVPKGECFFVRHLESQKAVGKSIYGGGYLLSERAAAEREAAERAAAEREAAERAAAERAAAEKTDAVRWALSPSELSIIKSLERRKT